MNSLNIIILLCFGCVRTHQNWDSTQQLVYDIGNEELSEVFIHLDNQTLEMKGNKNLYLCIQKVRDLTIHCIDTIAIQWRIKDSLLKTVKLNDSEIQRLNDLQIPDIILESELNKTVVTPHQLICCVLTELFDCMEYSIRKECNDNAFEELRQIHALISDDNYLCQDSKRTDFCTKVITEMRKLEKTSEVQTEPTSGQTNKTIQFLLIKFQIILFYIFIK